PPRPTSVWSGRFMATHHDDPNTPRPDEHQPPKKKTTSLKKTGVPDMSLEAAKLADPTGEEIPILEEAEPVEEIPVLEEATGADLPTADVTGSEHVLGDDLATAQPASAPPSGEQPLSVAEVVEEASEIHEAEAVLGDEPLDRGSRPSARAESPIRAEGGGPVDYGTEP